MTINKKKLHISRLLASVLLVFAMLPLLAFPAYAAESGSCGSNLTWIYNAGTLTISGSGDMNDFRDRTYAPWHEYREDITRINLSEGITSIGDFAFYSCSALKEVSLPDSVKRIGKYSFTSCAKLQTIRIGNLVETIDDAAFYNCFSLRAVRLPYNLKYVGSQAFYRCESLSTVAIPRGVTYLGDSTFAYCKSLVRAEVNADITTVPAWTFYGCEALSVVYLNSTITATDNYAFKECENLDSVYYPGNANTIKNEISEDVPGFASGGFVGDDPIPDSVTSTVVTENLIENTVTQTNTTVVQDDNITLTSTVTRVQDAEDSSDGTNSFDITLTVESSDGWDEAIDAIKKPLSEMAGTLANPEGDNTVNIDVYVKDGTEVPQEFLDVLVGRDVNLEITTEGGSTWRVNGEDIVKKEGDIEAIPPKQDFSHTLQEATDDIKDKVGTDNSYLLNFNQTTENRTEILVQLPPSATQNGSNAYLYQVEENGEHTRLQGVKVDNDSVAHFFLANTDKDTQYVIGVNVPDEKTDDIIYPAELNSAYGNALQRLEQIEYAVTGERTVGGLSLGQILIIVFVGLGLAMIVVGVVMFFWNKKRLERRYTRPAN